MQANRSQKNIPNFSSMDGDGVQRQHTIPCDNYGQTVTTYNQQETNSSRDSSKQAFLETSQSKH